MPGMTAVIKKVLIMVAGVSVLLLTGCTTYGELALRPDDSQTGGYYDGDLRYTSKKKNLVELVIPEVVELGGRARMLVVTGNGDEFAYRFSPEKVGVYFRPTIGNAQTCKIYTYEELVQEQRTRAAWMAFAAALSGAANQIAASNAGYSYQSGTYSGMYSGNIYSANVSSFGGTYSGTYSGVTYNPYIAEMARQQAQEQTNQQLMMLMESSDRAVSNLKRNILKENVVEPGQFCGGQIVFDVPQLTEKGWEDLEVTVNTGIETHTFKFGIRPKE